MTRSRSLRQTSLMLAVAAAAAGGAITASGCAGQGDIDRTQPDKIDKSILFDPATKAPKVWYYRETTVEAPPETNWAFEGIQNQMDKIYFVVTEARLIGYRSYDYAVGAQNDFTNGPNNTDTPVLIFNIKSHFDVKREYNPATGEQTNVISENTTDRPWDQRQYMRVDWTVNLADPNNQPNNPAGFVPLTYWVGEADSSRPDFADRPIFSNDVIDYVTEAVITPDYAACATLYGTVDEVGPSNCGDAQVKTRHSFLSVKPSTYLPLEYPDSQPLTDATGTPIQTLNAFGALYPCTADVIARTAGQFTGADCTAASMPEFSKFGYFRTVRQTYDRNVGATEAGHKYYANRWNIWQDSVQRNADGTAVLDASGNPTPLPYAQRQIKPLTYYTNIEFPDDDPDLLKQAQAVVADWSDAFKKTVAGVLKVNGGNGIVSPTDMNTMAATLPEMAVLKRNSCNLTDFTARLKQYSDLEALVKTATTETADTLDKQHLAQACSVVEAATASLADGDAKKFTWQRNGDLRYSFLFWVDRPQPSGPLGYGPSSADPETGEIVSASAYLYGAALDVYAQTAATTVDLLNNNISTDDLLSGKTITDVLKETAAARQVRSSQALTAAARSRASSFLNGTGATTPAGTPRLLPIPNNGNQSNLQAVKGTPVEQLLVDQNIIAAKVPSLKPGDTPTQAQLDQASPLNWLSDSARQARQSRFQQLAMNGCLYMAEFADDGIIGLALELKQQGLSGDALFKALRTLIFRGLADHEMGHTMGLRHNFSGSSDALNYSDSYWQIRTTLPQDQWPANRLSEYQYSTVMDYGSRFNSDVNGLGKYDLAAIRFGYGQLVDVMPAPAISMGMTDVNLANQIFYNDYTKLPTTLGGVANMADGGVQSYDTISSNARAFYQGLPATGSGGFLSPERPYMFCSDEYIGSLFCKQWDFGANQQEIVNDVIDRYKNYYFFSAFKRGQLNWSIDGYMNRLLDRYFNHFTEAFQFYYFLGSAVSGSDLGDDLLKASIDSLNALGEVLETPEPGVHCPTQLSPNIEVLPSGAGASACLTGQPSMNIEPPDGRPYFIDFSNDYYYRITRAGSLYEKLAALSALTTTETHFARVDTVGNANVYAINYYRIFKNEMLGLLSGVIKNDVSLYGGYVDGSGTYQPRPVVDLSTWGLVNAPVPPYMQTSVKRVDTPVNKTIQYYALWLALGNLDTTWDSTLDIGNYMSVTVKGSNDDVQYAPTVTVAEFTHPQSGLVYRAPTYAGSQPGIGVQLIGELTQIVGQVGTPGSLDTKYGLFNGQPLPDWQTAKAALDVATAGSDQTALNNAQSLFQFVDFQLSYRVDLLDDLRMFKRAFGY